MAPPPPPAARKRPAPDEAFPTEAGGKIKRSRYNFENIDDYEMLEEIGEGAIGVVARARDRRTGDTVAVKWIRRHGGAAGAATSLPAFVREAGCLAACRGLPGVVQVKSVATDEADGDLDLYIVMELVAGRTLRSHLAPEKPFSEDETRDAMRQLLEAAQGLHATGTVHRDVNPDNVLVGHDGALKICGFGCATPAARPKGKATCPVPEVPAGTMQYRSPEQLIDGRSFGPEADTWALGCVMAEMLAGEPLFTATTEEDMLTQVIDLHDDLVTMGVEAFDGVLELSTAGREVLADLLSYDSWERLTAAEALKYRWFAEDDEEEAKAPTDVETLYPGFVPLFSEA